MSTDWKAYLDKWTAAGLLDSATAGRIRGWEQEHQPAQGLRWPIVVALAFGALLLCAGVLLFVSAHWDELSPWQRMSLVVLMIGGFHAAGAAAAGRFEGLSIALHTIGSVTLGAGIALAGQIFHLSEHWPSAILLWAVGTTLAWIVLGHWTQATLTAILVPYWLASEWWVRTAAKGSDGVLIATAACALSFTYLSLRRAQNDSTLRKALGWLGGIALLPAVFAVAQPWIAIAAPQEHAVAWLVALLGPLALAWVFRRSAAVWNVVAVGWTLVLVAAHGGSGEHLLVYPWCAIGAVGLVAWGIRESRSGRINLGIAGFAITVFAFYFSSVMGKLGRSASLMILGLLFLGGGWFLERTRRRLVARI
ncbi:MAG TPA: DUF2157 domain-containing protein [Bryobacteraceae bacterium]|jgi:uncharacterized membrane protein|nr:DUF2157 domain-containing protein [Bryobacteraceae bacterium]